MTDLHIRDVLIRQGTNVREIVTASGDEYLLIKMMASHNESPSELYDSGKNLIEQYKGDEQIVFVNDYICTVDINLLVDYTEFITDDFRNVYYLIITNKAGNDNTRSGSRKKQPAVHSRKDKVRRPMPADSTSEGR